MPTMEQNEEYEEVFLTHIPLHLTGPHPQIKYRWLSQAGIKVTSEKKQRLLSKRLITTEVIGEVAPFTHSIKGGGEEIRKSAMAYIPNLGDKIIELLEQHHRYIKKSAWFRES